MKIAILFVTFVSVYLAARYLSFAISRLKLLAIRDEICIDRFKPRHKICDKALLSYYSIAMLVHLWGCALLSSLAFDFSIPTNVIVIVSSIIVGLLIFQIIYRVALEKKYDLIKFYIDLINARSKLDVVSKDNDHEVNYIRVYDEFVSEKKWDIIWALYVVFLTAIFFVK